MENETAQEPIIVKIKAPLFNRLIASLIDFIGLGILGFILGLFFKSFFALMENHGVLIGWFISSIYFALGNSRFLSGQTFGKWMSSVKVVDTNGHFLNIKIAIIRSLLFTTPYFLLEYVQQLYIIPNIIQIFLAIITISYYIGLVYFLIFNTQSRQTIHDFVPKTVVIRENQDTENIYFGISRIKIYSYV